MIMECAPLDEHTTRSMRSNKRKDTGPELKLRKALRDAGFPGYRLQWDVPGRPDICYPGRKVAIFVNGCFWHKHEGCHYFVWPRNNADFWKKKIEGNVERDKYDYKLLKDLGWHVIVVWECELKSACRQDTLDRLAEKIYANLESDDSSRADKQCEEIKKE